MHVIWSSIEQWSFHEIARTKRSSTFSNMCTPILQKTLSEQKVMLVAMKVLLQFGWRW